MHGNAMPRPYIEDDDDDAETDEAMEDDEDEEEEEEDLARDLGLALEQALSPGNIFVFTRHLCQCLQTSFIFIRQSLNVNGRYTHWVFYKHTRFWAEPGKETEITTNK